MNGGEIMNREDFPMLRNDLIYFDNGATTLKPQCVIDEITNYYENYSANAHRGGYDISRKVDELYEETRDDVKTFINASRREEIIFTKGTTESMNMIIFGFMKNYLQKDDEVLITKTEHASNVLPWYTLEKEIGIKVKFIPLEDYEVTIDNVKKSINDKTKVISLAWVTNTIGDIRPIKEITKVAHDNNILMVVDGAQSVPHFKTDVLDNDIDFEASVADQQNYEVMNILHKYQPDMYLSRHPGSTVWAIKNGTPAIYVADEYMIFGYKHTLEFAKTILDAVKNRSFEENLARRSKLPYTDWWYKQDVATFLEEAK